MGAAELVEKEARCDRAPFSCKFYCRNPGGHVVKLTLRDKETAQEAVRRFRKLVERSGIKKEMRVREFYEKPSEIRRRARLRAQRRSRRERTLGPMV
jgi:small subunit ribosomal protein S21